jgi:hypothetical protein
LLLEHHHEALVQDLGRDADDEAEGIVEKLSPLDLARA